MSQRPRGIIKIMTTTSRPTLAATPSPATIAGRLALIGVAVVALVLLSTPLRTIEPLQLRIATNIAFFIVLGMLDEWLLAPVLNRWPLLRAAVLVAETLALGWFFSPGRVTPTSKFLFYTHLGPFFVAVFGGALVVALARWWRSRSA